MNAVDFKDIVDSTVAETAELLIKKNKEYAGSEDVLANFKRNGEHNGQSQLECWMVYFNKHIDSIHTYMLRVKKKSIENALKNLTVGDTDPDLFLREVKRQLCLSARQVDEQLSEPLDGRLNDIINYCILCKALLQDIRNGGE